MTFLTDLCAEARRQGGSMHKRSVLQLAVAADELKLQPGLWDKAKGDVAVLVEMAGKLHKERKKRKRQDTVPQSTSNVNLLKILSC